MPRKTTYRRTKAREALQTATAEAEELVEAVDEYMASDSGPEAMRELCRAIGVRVSPKERDEDVGRDLWPMVAGVLHARARRLVDAARAFDETTTDPRSLPLLVRAIRSGVERATRDEPELREPESSPDPFDNARAQEVLDYQRADAERRLRAWRAKKRIPRGWSRIAGSEAVTRGGAKHGAALVLAVVPQAHGSDVVWSMYSAPTLDHITGAFWWPVGTGLPERRASPGVLHFHGNAETLTKAARELVAWMDGA